MKQLLVILAALLLMATAAEAQTRRPVLTGDPVADIKAVTNPESKAPHLTGDLHKDVLALKAQIDKALMADLEYASKMAAAANTPGSLVRKQCVDAVIALKIQLDGTTIKDATGNMIPKPDPALISGVEQVAEVIDALATTGPLFTACAGAAQLAKTSTLTLVSTIFAGASAFTAIAPIIP